MRLFILLAPLLFYSCFSKSNGHYLKADCSLVELAETKASCGIYSVWVGMKFIQISTGKIFIGLIHCPDGFTVDTQNKRFFVPARVYRIVASHSLDIRENDVVLNEYEDAGLSIYRVVEIDVK